MHHTSRIPALASMMALAAALVTAAAPASAASVTRYVTVSTTIGTPGRQTVEVADDGLVTVTSVYKNNGRGPELTERFRLRPDGTYASYHVQGKNTYDGPVDDRYQRGDDRAEWQSTSERGSARVDGPALYLPLWSSWEPVSVAIGALARRPDGRLPMLPSGTLTQRKVDEADVVSGTERRRVQLLVQTGLGLQPFFVWATTGASPRFFAYADMQGEITIEDGWEGNRGVLEAAQGRAEAAVLRDRAARLRHPLPGLTVIRNARIFDSAAARLLAPSDVYVLRGRISAVLPAGSTAQAPDNEIDAAGRVLVPGLFDMHVHMDRWSGLLHLASGVTTGRDMGSDNAALQRMIDDATAGTLLLPQIVPCGFLEGRSAFSSSNGITVSTLAEAKAAVDWYAQRGYPQLKIYNSFPREHLRETVAYAHARGMRVSGHVPAFLRAQDAVDAGFDEIQHINQVALNFLVRPETDTRTLERFKLPAERWGEVDLDGQPVRDFIELLRARQVVIDPTLATFDFIQQRDGEVSRPMAAVADHLPPDVRRWMTTGGLSIPDDATAARNRRSYDRLVQFAGRLHSAGVPIVAGTDSWPGIALVGELELYVQAGIAAPTVLQIATLGAARVAGVAADRGSIEPGKRADLLLVDGDPTRTIGDLRRIALVLTQGHWMSPKEMHEELGFVPFVQAVPTVRRLTP